MRTHILILLTASLCATTTAQQQDSTYTRTMVIERDFAPIVQQASKIDLTPDIDEPAPTRTPVTYATWKAPLSTPLQAGTLPAGQVIVTHDDAQLGYIDASLGNYMNTNIDAGLHHQGFTLDAALRYTKGDIDLNHGKYKLGTGDFEWQSKFALGRLVAGYSHTFDNDARLSVKAGIEGSKYDLFNWTLFSDAWNSHSSQREQKAGSFLAGATFDQDDWHLGLDFTHTGVHQPKTYTYYPDASANTLMLNAIWYGHEFRRFHIAFDLKAGFSAGDWDGFTVKPALHASLFPDEDELRRIYLDAAAGYEHTPLDRIISTYPLALIPHKGSYEKSGFAGLGSIHSRFDVADATLGYEDNENGYLRWKAYVGGRQSLNALGHYAYDAGEGSAIVFNNYTNMMFQAGFAAQYEYDRHFSASADLSFTANSKKYVDTEVPNFRSLLHIYYTPILPLTFDLSFLGGFMRDGYYYDGNDMTKVSLDPIIDLGLRADYRFSRHFSLYVYGQNLLNQSTDLWTLVPAQGINIHGGFHWEF